MEGILSELDPPTSPSSRVKAVRETPELRRVRALSTRDWEHHPRLSELVSEMTRRLRTGAPIAIELLPANGGVVPDALLPAQAVGILDARKGALIPLVTGGGKTLLTLLTPTAADVRRSVLLLPKGMIGKTLRTAKACAPYWRVPDVLHYLKAGKWRRQVHSPTIRHEMWIVNYEILPHRPSILLDLHVDLLLADESHYLKHTNTARTKIIRAFRKRQPSTPMSFLSGSMMGRDPRELAHLARWSLGTDHAPVPADWVEMESWALAIAEKVDDFERIEPGALLTLGDTEGDDPLDTARKRFCQRLTSTPRVVSAANDLPPCGLIVREWRAKPHAEMQRWLDHLRAKNELPDGEPCTDPLSKWAKERQVCHGFWYRYVEPPPPEWLAAKRAWAAASMDVLQHSTKLFSALDIAKQCDRGEAHAEVAEALKAWRGVRPTFTPETQAVWYDDAQIELAHAWLASNPRGLLWVSLVEFGLELSEKSNIPFFQSAACDAKGRHIYEHRGPAIVSAFTCATGLDLQYWHANLLLSPLPGEHFEQLISRTHRRGQQADDVTCDVLLRTESDEMAWLQCQADARLAGALARKRLQIATIVRKEDENGN